MDNDEFQKVVLEQLSKVFQRLDKAEAVVDQTLQSGKVKLRDLLKEV